MCAEFEECQQENIPGLESVRRFSCLPATLFYSTQLFKAIQEPEQNLQGFLLLSASFFAPLFIMPDTKKWASAFFDGLSDPVSVLWEFSGLFPELLVLGNEVDHPGDIAAAA